MRNQFARARKSIVGHESHAAVDPKHGASAVENRVKRVDVSAVVHIGLISISPEVNTWPDSLRGNGRHEVRVTGCKEPALVRISVGLARPGDQHFQSKKNGVHDADTVRASHVAYRSQNSVDGALNAGGEISSGDGRGTEASSRRSDREIGGSSRPH